MAAQLFFYGRSPDWNFLVYRISSERFWPQADAWLIAGALSFSVHETQKKKLFSEVELNTTNKKIEM